MELKDNLVFWVFYVFVITGNTDPASSVTFSHVSTIISGSTQSIEIRPTSVTGVQTYPSSSQDLVTSDDYTVITDIYPTSEFGHSRPTSSPEILVTSSAFDNFMSVSDISAFNRSVYVSSSESMSSVDTYSLQTSEHSSAYISQLADSLVSNMAMLTSEVSTTARSETSLGTSIEMTPFSRQSQIEDISSFHPFTSTDLTSSYESMETADALASLHTSLYTETSYIHSLSIYDNTITVFPSSSASVNCTENCSPPSGKGKGKKHVSSTVVGVVVVVVFVSVIVGIVCYKRNRRCGLSGLGSSTASYRRFKDEDNERVYLNSVL